MAAAGRVGICLDASMGRPLARILRELRAAGSPDIEDARDLGLGDSSDEVLLAELARRQYAALIALDSRMLRASVRRDAWRASGISLFLTDGKWGNLPLFEQGRRLFWWWPAIVEQARAGPQGGAWRVAADMVPSGMRQMFAEGGRPP